MLEVTVFSKPIDQALTQFQNELASAPEMAIAKGQVALSALQDIKRDFAERSRAGNPDWPELAAITVVLRRRGRGGRIYSPEDLAARRARTAKLRDTNLLMASLQAGAPGNVTDIREFSIRVGTNRPGAGRHQTGGPSEQPFAFGPEQQARFKANVSKTKKGRHEPPALPPDHKYRWGQDVRKRRFKLKTAREMGFQGLGAEVASARAQADYYARGYWWHLRPEESPWNPLYFALWNYARKISGTVRHVPRREIVSQPDFRRMGKYARLLEQGLRMLAQRLGM